MVRYESAEHSVLETRHDQRCGSPNLCRVPRATPWCAASGTSCRTRGRIGTRESTLLTFICEPVPSYTAVTLDEPW